MIPQDVNLSSAFRTDVLVIGGGLAGHRAAIEARRNGVAVVMLYPSRGASPFIIGCNAPLGHEDISDSPQIYFEDMVRGGYQLNDRRLVQVLAEGAAGDVYELAQIGVPLARVGDKFAQRHLSGNRYPRSVFHPNGFGAETVGRLAKHCEEIGVEVLGSRKAIALLRDGDEVCGALALRRRTGELTPIYARAVVLACGGLGQIFADSTYPADISSDSYAMAVAAGATLIDMEFVQFEPTVACYPESLWGLEMPTAMLGDGAQLINADGERFMIRYNPEAAEKRMEKAKLSLIIQKEINEGRGFPEGGILFDTTKVPGDKLESYVTHCRRMRAAGLEPRKEGIQIRPAAHSQMGGIRIDACGWTGVPGLYAGGEAAGGVHGASRLAGNGGSDAMVFGRIAGHGAIKGLTSSKDRDWHSIVTDALDSIAVSGRTDGGVVPAEMKAQIREVMSRSAGLYRTGEQLKAGFDHLSRMRAAIRGDMRLCDAEDWAAAIEASNMVVAGQAVIASALARKESRGAHQRLDHPLADDAFLVHIALRSAADGELALSTVPIA